MVEGSATRTKSAPTLRGRDTELQVFDQALRAAPGGIGETLLIEGEPGIGKTELLRAAAERATEMGYCALGAGGEQLERGRPFGVMIDALGCRAGAADSRRAKIGRLAADVLVAASGWGGMADTRFLVQEAIVSLVDELAGDQPLFLALDDLQWADAATLATIAALGRQVEALPLVLLGAFRSSAATPELARLVEALGARGARHLRLGPLALDDVVGVAEEMTGSTPTGTLLDHLTAATGNPLLVVELLKAAVEDDALEITNGLADLRTGDLPPSLHDVVVRRLESLAPGTNLLLQVGSVLGSAIMPVEWAALLGRSVASLHPEIEAASRAGLLRADGEWLRFQHDLVRDVIYETVPPPVRSALHEQAARALAGLGAAPELVARHVSLAEGAVGTDQLDWLQGVAREAVSRDPATAAELFGRARELADPASPEHGQLLVDEVSALAWCGHLDDAEAKARRGLADGAGSAAPALQAGLGELLVLQGRMGDAIEPLRIAATHEDLPESRRAWLLAEAATARLWSLDIDGGDADAVTAIALGEQLGEPVPVTVGWCVRSRAAALRAEFHEAVDYAKRALAAAGTDPAAQRSSPHLYLGIAVLHFDPAAADRALREGRRASEEVGAPWMLPNYQSALTTAAFYAGQWDDALAEGQAGRLIAEEVGNRVGAAQILGLTGLIHFHRADFNAARAALSDAHEELGAPGAIATGIGYVLWLEALLAEREGQLDAAFAPLRLMFEGSGEVGAAVTQMWFGPEAVRLALACGDQEHAHAIASELSDISTRARTPIAVAAAMRAEGLVADDADLLVKAAELLRHEPRQVDFAIAAEGAGLAFARANRREEAIPMLTESAATFEALGANHVTRRISAALRNLGVSAGARGPRRRPATGWDSLTPTESRVVELVSEGLTNPEIGRRLFISRRTVETHLSHIFDKLQVRSRAAVATAASEQRSRVEGDP